ncbi:MAG: hypothetical protein WCF94_03915 [bacterium]
MAKRGAKAQNKVNIKWSANFAYAIGLIVTDGCLSKDGRHVSFVSKDLDQVENYKISLKIDNKIGKTYSGFDKKMAHRIQFGDVSFCSFLNDIGITKNKSKTIGEIKVPNKYFFDFLRGCFDGDGSFYSYWDKRWKSSFMFYTEFVSASKKHIDWLQSEIFKKIKVSGHITKGKNNVCYQLKYAKADSLKLLKKMYYKDNKIHLERKRLKIVKVLGIVGEKLP